MVGGYIYILSTARPVDFVSCYPFVMVNRFAAAEETMRSGWYFVEEMGRIIVYVDSDSLICLWLPF